MSTITYTFAGITNPSGTHIAWSGFDPGGPPAGGALVQIAEALDADYAALAPSDDSRATAWGRETTVFASHGLWEFDWLITVDRAEVTRIDLSCKGLGFADSGDGWRLHVRKNTGVGAPVWELLDTEPTNGEATLTGAVTADILDYITADGHVYVLAEQEGTYVESVVSTIQVDMTFCQLTYTPAAPLVADAGADKSVGSGGPGSSTVIGGAPTASGGTPPYTYAWVGNVGDSPWGLDSLTTANPTASPAATMTYTVTVTDAVLATDDDSCTVTRRAFVQGGCSG